MEHPPLQKFLARETARLTEVSRQVAEKKGVEENRFFRGAGEGIRRHGCPADHGQELTASLQAQWKMEQQQREQINPAFP